MPLMLLIVIPLSIVLGRIHHRTQLPTEAKIKHIHDPYNFMVIPNSKEIILIRSQILALELLSKVTKDQEMQAKVGDVIANLEFLLDGERSEKILD